MRAAHIAAKGGRRTRGEERGEGGIKQNGTKNFVEVPNWYRNKILF